VDDGRGRMAPRTERGLAHDGLQPLGHRARPGRFARPRGAHPRSTRASCSSARRAGRAA
jgi:hypothetical protein